MTRWALFVDAGWLFAAGSTSAFGERADRKEIGWSPKLLPEAVAEEAAKLVPESAELLRIYWYDGSPNRLPIGDQHIVAALPDVKLRLGRTARDGQKGVDGLIIHDLITHAYRRTIDDAVVLSGDEDLLDAIESAQANGTRVHLLEVPIGGIADGLLRAVDRRGLLDELFWKEHFFPKPTADHSVTPSPTHPSSVDANNTIVSTTGSGEASSAGEERSASATQSPSSPVGTSAALPSPPRMAGPAVRPSWMDTHKDEARAAEERQRRIGDLVDRGQQFAETWSDAHSFGELGELLSARPYLPREIDAQLLRAATDGNEWLDESERRTLRDAFWRRLADI